MLQSPRLQQRSRERSDAERPVRTDSLHLVTMRQKSIPRIILQPLAIAVVLALAARAAFHIFSIPSASMAPALLPGDVVLVTRYWRSSPQPGDVVVFRHPAVDDLLIKRVVAVPGDYVDSYLGRVRIGGHTKAEPYLADVTASGPIQAQLVPGESYFVMGDDRANSTDSRSLGAVPRSLIVGRARLVLWSVTPSAGTPAFHPSRLALNRIFKCVH